MGLSSFVSRVIPAAVGFVTGGPVGATTAILATEQAKKQERSIKRAVEQRQQQENKLRRDLMAMGS
jgi:gas vesicle protein